MTRLPVLHWSQAQVIAWERQPPGDHDPPAARFEVDVPAAAPGLGKLLSSLSGTTGQGTGVVDLQGSSTARADGSYVLRLTGSTDVAADEPVTPDTLLGVLQGEVEQHCEE